MANAKKPNIILIICDQMRGDCFGAAGNKQIHTPNIDYLAAQGSRFSAAYSAVPSCLPARASLFTGQNQWHTGVLGMGRGQSVIPNDFPHTLAGELSKAGYQTHMAGKGHFSPQRALMGFGRTELDESGRTLKSGFADEYRKWFKKHAPASVTPDDHGVDWNSWHARPWHIAEFLHPSAWTMERSIKFIEAAKSPFFLNISFARPHSPYVPPQPYFDRYIQQELPEPYLGKWSHWHDDPDTALDPNAWRGKMSPDDIKRARAGYYGEISFIDSQIGRLLNWLRRFRPQALRDSWLVFTSDHGDMLGDHNLWRKTYAYEGSARIPLLIVPPRSAARPKRPVVREVTELRDIMPTILEAAGLPVPETVDGQSLCGLMQKAQPGWRKYIHGEHCQCYSPEQEMQFVTDGKRKFIWFPRLGREQFFDLEKDPGECNDLIKVRNRQKEVNKWRGYLIKDLKARKCGWIKDGKLHAAEGPLVSPYKNKRWESKSLP